MYIIKTVLVSLNMSQEEDCCAENLYRVATASMSVKFPKELSQLKPYNICYTYMIYVQYIYMHCMQYDYEVLHGCG